jgi:hypothetical protein
LQAGRTLEETWYDNQYLIAYCNLLKSSYNYACSCISNRQWRKGQSNNEFPDRHYISISTDYSRKLHIFASVLVSVRSVRWVLSQWWLRIVFSVAWLLFCADNQCALQAASSGSNKEEKPPANHAFTGSPISISMSEDLLTLYCALRQPLVFLLVTRKSSSCYIIMKMMESIGNVC